MTDREKAIIKASIMMGNDIVLMSANVDCAVHKFEVFLKRASSIIKDIDREKLCIKLTNGSKVYFIYGTEQQLLGRRSNTVCIDQDAFKIKIKESEE